MMHPTSRIPAFAASLIAFATFADAQSFYVDVTNAVANPQFHIPTGYASYPSYDNPGTGFSVGSSPGRTVPEPERGDYFIADGFLGGSSANGLWQSSWLDAIYPAEDLGPHGGEGTPDIIGPGGINGYSGTTPVIFGNGLVEVPETSADANGQYLGLGASGSNSEYALWGTPMVVTTKTTFQFQYIWSPAGATLADGTEFAVDALMGARFFVDTNTNYSDGIQLSQSSGLEKYEGAGNQDWITETGTFELEAGTYYWGFSAESGGPLGAYIAVENISVIPIPEPSGALLAVMGAGTLALRRRRFSGRA